MHWTRVVWSLLLAAGVTGPGSSSLSAHAPAPADPAGALGTELPRYSSELTVEKAEKGRFRIRGTLTQSGVSESFLALVPVYVDLGDGRLATFGRAPFRGSMTRELDVTLELPKKPKRVGLNLRREVLALEARRPS